MEQNFTMNEVIHLFLDGEATNAQRSSLFTAMANDSGLQDEFDRALKLKNALAAEAQTVRPSALLTAALFEKAGVATLGLGGGAAVGTAVTTAVKTGWFAAAAKFLIPAATALLGGAATYTLMHNSEGKSNTDNIRNEQIVSTQNESQNSSLQNRATNISGATSNGIQNTSRGENDAVTSSKEVKNIPSNSTAVKVKTVYVHIPVHDTIYKPAVVDPDLSNAANPPAQSSNEMPQVASATPRNEDAGVEKSADIAGVVDTRTSLTSLRGDQSNASNWLVGVRGVSAMAIYPERDLSSGAADIFNNVSINVQYDVSHNHSFGIEGGTESFPINVVNSDGSIYKKWSLALFGGYYRFTADQIGFLGNIRPFFQVLGGGSISGPIGKLTSGIIWEPGDRVQLMLGVEGMQQWYTYQSNWYHGQKLSMTTGVAVRF
jgi:hypothetical protein